MVSKIEKQELYVQKYLLSDIKYIHNALLHGMQSDWFSEGVSFYFMDALIEHYKERGTCLSKPVIRDILERNRIPEATISTYLNYIDEITNLEPDEENFEYWFDEVKKEYLGKQLKLTLNVVINAVKDTHDYELGVSLLTDKISELNNIKVNREEGLSLRNTAEKRWDQYQDVKNNPDAYKGVLTGYLHLDEALNGMMPGELGVVVSRSGVGKSVFLNCLAHEAYINGHNVLFGGIEMSPELNIKRFESLMGSLPLTFLRRGKLTDCEEDMYKAILDIQSKMTNEMVFIPQQQCDTIDSLELEIKQFKNKYGKLDLLVVDYLNILTMSNTKGMKGHEIQRAVVEKLRGLAIKYAIPIWTAAQSNRESTKDIKHEGSTEIISSSDFIGNCADLILNLYTDTSDEDSGTITCNIIKGRNLERGKFKLRRNYATMKICDIESGYAGVDL